MPSASQSTEPLKSSQTRQAAGAMANGLDALLPETKAAAERVKDFLKSWHDETSWRNSWERRCSPTDDAQQAPQATVPPFGEQVLLIDGPRGAGKTTLILTLEQELKQKSRDADPWVLCCPSIDLQHWVPDRHDIPSLFAERLRQLVKEEPEESLFPPQSGARPSGARRDRQRLDEAHRKLQKALASRRRGQGEAKAELEEWAEAEGDVHRTSLELESLFSQFIDLLLWVIRPSRNGDVRVPLLMIFIDDVDMRPESIVPLLRAVRMVRHPRLAILFAGDADLIQQVCRQSVKATQLLGDDAYFTSQLGERLFNRSVPPNQRVHIRPMTMQSIGEFRPPSPGGKTGEGSKLHNHLKNWLNTSLSKVTPSEEAELGALKVLENAFSVNPLPRRPRAVYDLYLHLDSLPTNSAQRQLSDYSIIHTLISSALSEWSPPGPVRNRMDRVQARVLTLSELSTNPPTKDDPTWTERAHEGLAQIIILLTQEVKLTIPAECWALRPPANDLTNSSNPGGPTPPIGAALRYFGSSGRIEATLGGEPVPGQLLGLLFLLEDLARGDAQTIAAPDYLLPPHRALNLLAPRAKVKVSTEPLFLRLPLKPPRSWVEAARLVAEWRRILVHPAIEGIDDLVKACGGNGVNSPDSEELCHGASLLNIPEFEEVQAIGYAAFVPRDGKSSAALMREGRNTLVAEAAKRLSDPPPLDRLRNEVDSEADRLRSDVRSATVYRFWREEVGFRGTTYFALHHWGLGLASPSSEQIQEIPLFRRLLGGRALAPLWEAAADVRLPELKLEATPVGEFEGQRLHRLQLVVDGRHIGQYAGDSDACLLALLAAERHSGIGGVAVRLPTHWPGLEITKAPENTNPWGGPWLCPSSPGVVDIFNYLEIWNLHLPWLLMGGELPKEVRAAHSGGSSESEQKTLPWAAEQTKRWREAYLTFQLGIARWSGAIPQSGGIRDRGQTTSWLSFPAELIRAIEVLDPPIRWTDGRRFGGARAASFVQWAKDLRADLDTRMSSEQSPAQVKAGG